MDVNLSLVTRMYLESSCDLLGYVGAAPSPAYARVSGNLGHSSAVVASMIGALAGFMLAYQNSTGRLQGFLPNDEEAAEARS